MTTENFQKVLLAMIRRRPFKPFTVELNTGSRFEIDHPEATVIVFWFFLPVLFV